jgi:hypothetical protein
MRSPITIFISIVVVFCALVVVTTWQSRNEVPPPNMCPPGCVPASCYKYSPRPSGGMLCSCPLPIPVEVP